MDTLCQSDFCAADENRLSLKSARLEKEYEKALHQRNTLIGDEKYRLLLVDVLLLENDNDELNGQLQRVSEQLGAAQAAESHMQAQLLETENRHAGSQDILRAKSREINNLKSEIASLNNNSLDSNKLLTEKLGLTRELSTAKVELEHLRSQSESYQTLLTAKLSLDRQLSSLEVELDTAKRALERARAKDVSRKEEDSSAKAQLEELDKELARERKEREQVEEESRNQAAEWDIVRTGLESKLDAFRNELREARNQSGGMLGGIQEQRSKPQSRMSEESGAHWRQSRKRSIPQFDPDMTIGTPGDVTSMRAKPASALPGDKSMFSITPFLNRTSMSMESQLQDYSSSDSDRGLSHRDSKRHDSALGTEKKASVKQDAPKPSTTRPKKTAGNAAPETKAFNSKFRIGGPSSLENVPEENDRESESPERDSLKVQPSNRDAQKPKLKKQKFLGSSREKTLFDDDDEGLDEPRKNIRVNLGTGRGLGMRGGRSLTTAGNPPRGEALGEPGGRPEFSPLKKRKLM